MRNIDSIIVHCSATKAGQDFTATDIDRWHRERGFNGIGYHYVVRLDGKLEKGRDVSLAGAHCRGWNERSVGICYIGGLDANGRPADTRTNAQKRVLYQIIMDLQREYNILQVLGHRDTSPDLNGDGVIEPYEYVKVCPCFDVKEFLRSGRELLFVSLVALVVPVLLSGCRSKKEVINRESEVRVDSSLNSSSGKGFFLLCKCSRFLFLFLRHYSFTSCLTLSSGLVFITAKVLVSTGYLSTNGITTLSNRISPHPGSELVTWASCFSDNPSLSARIA